MDIIYDYRNPVLLDTVEKVEWANTVDPHRHTPWRLGDHCYMVPVVDHHAHTEKK